MGSAALLRGLRVVRGALRFALKQSISAIMAPARFLADPLLHRRLGKVNDLKGVPVLNC
jgi:hypothetical protein